MRRVRRNGNGYASAGPLIPPIMRHCALNAADTLVLMRAQGCIGIDTNVQSPGSLASGLITSMKPAKQLLLVAVLVSVVTIPSHLLAARAPDAPLHAVEHATAWLNSDPLSASDLRGKVVLVDFWTYTCINWRRTLPWLRAWDRKYRDKGLVIVGVHTPEFTFERDFDHVRVAARDEQVDYPIALDSDSAIWNAFGNQYWPALYLVDAQGHIRRRQFGEGEYDQLERVIQELLAEAGH